MNLRIYRQLFYLLLTLVNGLGFWGGRAWGQTNPTPQSLPYSQDFAALLYTSTTYPVGWQGWNLSSGGSTTSYHTNTPLSDLSLVASATAALSAAQVYNYNGKIGLLSSSSGNDPSICLAITTTGNTSISISYDIMTIRNPYDGSTNKRINEATLQYRIGTSGSFTSLTGIEYQNNTTSQTTGTTPQKIETKNIALPSACENQAVVQLRWAQRDVSGSGSRPSFSIDNVSVTSSATCTAPSGGATSLTASPSDITASLNWTIGNGGNRIVILNTSNTFTDPTDGTSPSANAVYSSGQQVVYNGTGNTVSVTGLSASTTYYFMIYEYNCSGAFTKFLVPGVSTSFITNSGSNSVEVKGTLPAPTDAFYSNLKLAFDAINNGTHKGVITVDILANTTETVTAALNGSGTGAASYTAVNIQPSGGASRVITGSGINGPLINLNGADNVTIDGRLGGIGSTKSLTITNPSASALASTIQFTNDASSNEVRYCVITGSNTSTVALAFGTIHFITGTSTGNNLNNINHNDIGDASGGLPSFAIFSYTNSGSISNDNNIIDNNNIYNYFHPSENVSGIYLKAQSGVTSNSGWIITNNKFYQTAARTTATQGNLYSAIRVGTSTSSVAGGGFNISGNIIGYGNSTGTGTTSYGPTPSTNKAYIFVAIQIFQNNSTSNVQGNQIAGISLNTTSAATGAPGIFSGISVEAGSVNVGTTTGNTIGIATTGLINITSSTSGAAIVPIHISSNAACVVQNNSIGAITTGGTASIGYAFFGIYVSGSGSHSVTSNFIGNGNPNSISIGTSGTTTAATDVYGIFSNATGTNIYIGNTIGTGNTIQNLTSYGTSTSSQLAGIKNAGVCSNFYANYNDIKNNTLAGGGGTVTYVSYAGIINTSAVSSSININYNSISNCTVSKNAYGGRASFIYNIAGGSGASFTVSNNTLSGFSFSGTSATGEFDAIYNQANMASALITSNNYNNLTIKTSGDFYFCRNTSNTNNTTFSNNYITNQFTKSTAGGYIYLYDNEGSPTGGTETISGNNFSNLTFTAATYFYGIFHATFTTNQLVVITNNTIANISGGSVEIDGIQVNFAANGSSVSGNTISNFLCTSDIYAISVGYLGESPLLNIFNNTIGDLKSNGASSYVCGVYVELGLIVNIFKNKIFNLEANNSTGYIEGIWISGGTVGSAISIYNNLIGNLTTPITNYAEAIDGIYITSSTASNINVYFNTIYLNATSTGANFGTTGIYHTTGALGTANLDLRNNIIVNTSTKKGTGLTVAYRRSDATLTNFASASNNNLFYTGATPTAAANPIFSDGTANDYSTLALYRTLVSTRETNSITEMPQFKSILGSDATFLHIQDDCTLTATGIESGGVALGSPYDTDFDSEYRFGNTLYAGGGTAPDIGADEFDKKALEVTTVPATGVTNYSTLKAAFTAINKGTHKDAITIKVLCNTTELSTAVLNASGTGSPLSSYTSVYLYPAITGKSISGNIDGAPLIDLNGADNVTFDGRLNGSGSTPDLAISNTSTSSASGTSTIRFQTDATNNLINFCQVWGSSTTTALNTNGGNIWIGANAAISGNDNNIISNCNIGAAGSNLPTKCIYLLGTTGKENSGISITANNIFDYFSAVSPSAGIYAENGNTLCSFTNNRLYQTSARAQTTSQNQNHYGIGIANTSGNGFTVSGNIIGYANSALSGIYSLTGCSSKTFAPIYLNVGNTTVSTVQGNTITAISFSNTEAAAAAFSGIEVAAGKVNIGNTTANIIGSATGNNAITIANNSSFSADVTGINYISADDGIISNNTIGSISSSSSTAYPCNIYGISKSAVAGALTISNNLIGSLSTPNSISAGSLATAVQYVYGISNSGTGTIAISGNTIANMNNAYSGSGTGAVAGICTNGTGTYTVFKNFIYGLTSPGSNPDIYGIRASNGASTFSNNIIYLGGNISAGCTIYGLYDYGTTGTNNYHFNTVYLGGTAGGTKYTYAMYAENNANTKTISNNIFYNARTGSGSHYAIGLPNTSLTIDYNDYYYSGTNLGRFNSANVASLAGWQAATTQDANSVSNNPNFSSAGGTSAVDYKPVFPVNLHGVTVSGINDDFGNFARHAMPTLGAWELACQSHGEWSGATSTDWNVAGNWCDNSVPGSGTDVIIQNVTNKPEITITTAACNNLTINPSAALNVNPGQALTVNGNLTNNGSLSINSTALDNNGSLIVKGSDSGTGATTYNRYLSSDRNFITSSPVNVTSGFSALNKDHMNSIYGDYNFAPYDEPSNSWLYCNSGNYPDALTPGKGYLAKLTNPSTNIQYTGTLNATDISIAVTGNSTNGWNAVGNPFTSAIGITSSAISTQNFLAENSGILDPSFQAIYLWYQSDGTSTGTGVYTPGVSQFYRTINNVGYLGRAYGGPVSENYVQAGQGFLVNVSSAQTINFTKAMQIHSPAVTMKSQEYSWPGVTLLASNNGRSRSTIVAFNDKMTTGLDPSYDAGLLTVSDFNLYTHLVDGGNDTHFTIQCLPENLYDSLAVPLGIELPQAGSVTLKVSGVILPDGVYPVIEDRLLQISTALKGETDSLVLNLDEPLWGTGRFYLRFGGVINTVGTGSHGTSTQLSAYFGNGKIRINGTPAKDSRACLYDLSGRKLLGEYRLTSANLNEIPAEGIASGVYLLRIDGKNSSQAITITIFNR